MSDFIGETSIQKKKTGLGRGLGSLLSPSTIPEGDKGTEEVEFFRGPVGLDTVAQPNTPPDARIWKISVDKLQANKNQPRQVFDNSKIKELSDSIKEKGILQPIVARKTESGQLEIIAGERRWRAAQMAGYHEVPVIIRQSTDTDSLELALIENIQRENLNSIEEAEAYDLLIKRYNLTQAEVALKVGKERATITNSLRLLSLPEEIRQMISQGEITQGHAKALLAITDLDQQLTIARKVVKDKISVRAIEQMSSKRIKEDSSKEINLDVDIAKRLALGLSEELQKTLHTKVNIDYSDSKGKISIYFYSDDELNSLVETIRNGCQK